MLTWILLKFGLALIDFDLIARALAARLLRIHGSDIDTLNPQGSQQELGRHYAILAVEAGLPVAAKKRVAKLAWRYIEQAQNNPIPSLNSRKEFSFYD
jgi:hypothetical protein